MLLGGHVHQYRRYTRIVLLTPLLPLPPLRAVKGGWVPDEPGPGQPGFSNKPVFKFVLDDFADGRLEIQGPKHVLLIRSLEGPSYTPNGGTRDRAVVRLSPVTRITPDMDAPVLGVFRRGDPQESLWRNLVVSGGGKQEDIVSICETPAWRVLLLPTAPLRVVVPGVVGDAMGIYTSVVSRFRDPGTGLWDAWLRTRFADGLWKPDPLGGDEVPPAKVTIRPAHERAVVQAMKGSPLLRALEKGIDRQTALEVLDAVLVARAYWPKKARREARLEAVTAFIQRWGSEDGVEIRLGEGDTPDIFDAAGPMPPERVADLALLVAHYAANAAKVRRVSE